MLSIPSFDIILIFCLLTYNLTASRPISLRTLPDSSLKSLPIKVAMAFVEQPFDEREKVCEDLEAAALVLQVACLRCAQSMITPKLTTAFGVKALLSSRNPQSVLHISR